MTLWSDCQGQDQIHPISGTLYRIVESQEQVATRRFVDSLAEQAVLEELLESSKPDYPATDPRLHYLLKTPFRYPPLPWGSRFGRVHEPSLFYGGRSVAATLAESAYYRLVFIASMQGNPPARPLLSEHSIFSVDYATRRGIRLQQPPFAAHKSALTHRSDYGACQQLGSAMRAANVAALEYTSARACPEAVCVALFESVAFRQTAPTSMSHWLCETTPDSVTFKEAGSRTPQCFAAGEFHVDGQLPMPA